MNQKLLLSSVVASMVLIGCGGGVSNSSDSSSKDSNNPGTTIIKNGDNNSSLSETKPTCNSGYDLKVYPCNPTIPSDGELRLQVAYEKNGNVVENSDDNEMYIDYKVANSNLIDTSGDYLVGKSQTGESKVTLTLKDKNDKTIASRDIKVKVVQADVKNIFVDPDSLLLQQNESATLLLTATDKEGEPTSFKSDNIIAQYDPSQLEYTTNGSTIELTALNSKGFTEFTPIYKNVDYNITVNSVIVGFHDKPDLSVFDNISVGNNFNLIEDIKGNKRKVYIVYDNAEHNTFNMAIFTGQKWLPNTIDQITGEIKSIKLVQAKDGYTLYALVANGKDSSLDLISYTSPDFKTWSQKKVLKDNLSGNTKLDAATTEDGNFVFISSGKDMIAIDTKNNQEYGFEFPDVIRAFSVKKDKDGEIRLAISAEEDTFSDIYYVEFNKDTNKFTSTKVIGSVESEVSKINLNFSKRGVPFISYMYTKNGAGSIHIVHLQDDLKWSGVNKISSIVLNKGHNYQDLFENLEDFKLYIDRFGLAKLLVKDGNNLYFIKENLDKDKNDIWMISRITDSINGDFDANMDKKNRLTVMYETFNSEHLGYWREPYYFKYRSKKATYKSVDDSKLPGKTLAPVNYPPVACFSYDNKNAMQGISFSLNAGCSSDRDGSVVEYNWQVDSGNGVINNSNDVNTTFKTDNSGSVTITLEVTDNRGKKDRESKTINIKPNPAFPTVDLSLTPAKDSYEVTEDITVTANAKDDKGASNLTYIWFVDNKAIDDHNSSIKVGPQSEGIHTIKVEVTDKDNHSASSELTISRFIDQAKVEAALNKIKNYYGGSSDDKPTVKDYLTIGVTGVDANNISAVNYQISKASYSDKNSKEEIQAIVDKVNNAIKKIQEYADDQSKDAPQISDYKTLWNSGVDANLISAYNYAISQKSSEQLKSVKDIYETVGEAYDSINKIKGYGGNSSDDKPTVKDYLTIGVTGVDANNISAVNYQISKAYYSDKDSKEEIQAIVDKVNNAIKKIQEYADDQSKDAPQISDYKTLWNTSTDANKISALNYGISQMSSKDLQSVEDIESVAIKVYTSLNKIKNYGGNSNDDVPTVKDYLTVGVTGVDANNISAVNEQISKAYYTDKDSKEEIQDIVDKVNSGN